MADLTYVTYCGLYCKHCVTLTSIPYHAKALYTIMKWEGFEFFGPYQSEKFNDFWDHLQYLSKLDESNPGCREGTGCGDPNCAIRACAREKNLDICVYCDEYPCEKFEVLTAQYPALLGDGKKLKEMGIDAWLKEQEERCERGYCFSLGRYDIQPE